MRVLNVILELIILNLYDGNFKMVQLSAAARQPILRPGKLSLNARIEIEFHRVSLIIEMVVSQQVIFDSY